MTIKVNSQGQSFQIPPFCDPDGDLVTLTIVEANNGILPNWILLTNSNTKLEATPTSFNDIGTHNLKIILSTVNEFVSYPFKIIVTNTAPYFIKFPNSPLNIFINEIINIDITGTY